jgi:hypothetical protein
MFRKTLQISCQSEEYAFFYLYFSIRPFLVKKRIALIPNVCQQFLIDLMMTHFLLLLLFLNRYYNCSYSFSFVFRKSYDFPLIYFLCGVVYLVKKRIGIPNVYEQYRFITVIIFLLFIHGCFLEFFVSRS